jgi:hypothetical protein
MSTYLLEACCWQSVTNKSGRWEAQHALLDHLVEHGSIESHPRSTTYALLAKDMKARSNLEVLEATGRGKSRGVLICRDGFPTSQWLFGQKLKLLPSLWPSARTQAMDCSSEHGW